MHDYYTTYASPIGTITLFSDGSFLTGLYLEHQKGFPHESLQGAKRKELRIFQETKDWLDNYFERKPNESKPKIRLEGSDFCKKVWKLLAEVPFGRTRSYKEITTLYKTRHDRTNMSAQAIGSAIGKNPISIIIPCHRIIGTDGELKGYAGGLEKKDYLLALEKKEV